MCEYRCISFVPHIIFPFSSTAQIDPEIHIFMICRSVLVQTQTLVVCPCIRLIIQLRNVLDEWLYAPRWAVCLVSYHGEGRTQEFIRISDAKFLLIFRFKMKRATHREKDIDKGFKSNNSTD